MAQAARGLGTKWQWVAAAAALVMTAAAIGLWARHGAAVFFDMLTAGIAYCFQACEPVPVGCLSQPPLILVSF